MLPLMPRNQKNKKWVKETEQIFKKFQESKWLICFIYWRIFRDWRWVIVYITLLQQADQFFAPRGALWKLFVGCGGDVYKAAFFEGVGYISVVFFYPSLGTLWKISSKNSDIFKISEKSSQYLLKTLKIKTRCKT